jgi:hypothetical protein
MTISKTLMLAAVAALSLGAGTAMAQDGSGGSFPDYWTARQEAAAARVPAAAMPVQSGSSDVLPQTGANHSAVFILNNGLYGAGGVGG